MKQVLQSLQYIPVLRVAQCHGYVSPKLGEANAKDSCAPKVRFEVLRGEREKTEQVRGGDAVARRAKER